MHSLLKVFYRRCDNEACEWHMLVCERALHAHDLSDLFNDVVDGGDGDQWAWLCTLLSIGVAGASSAQPVHIVNVRCVAQMLHRCALAFVAHTRSRADAPCAITVC